MEQMCLHKFGTIIVDTQSVFLCYIIFYVILRVKRKTWQIIFDSNTSESIHPGQKCLRIFGVLKLLYVKLIVNLILLNLSMESNRTFSVHTETSFQTN